MSDADYRAGWDAGFRKGLSAVEAGFTAHDMAQAREEGYSAGVQRVTQYERILTDLIAELRDEHATSLRWGDYYRYCYRCEISRDGCPTRDLADRAEARLSALTSAEDRAATGELFSPGTYEDLVEHSRLVAERKFGKPGDDLDDLCPHCGATKGVCGGDE